MPNQEVTLRRMTTCSRSTDRILIVGVLKGKKPELARLPLDSLQSD